MAESERFWKVLIGYIRDGTVVPVVGRDLLRPRIDGERRDFYTLIAGRLADELGVSEGLPEQPTPHDVACAVIDDRRIRREELYATLKDLTDETLQGLSEGSEPLEALPPALVKLAQIQPFQLFVSTTFDPLLERTLEQVRYSDGPNRTQTYSYAPERATDLEETWDPADGATVFHLLGRVSREPSYVVTEEDALEFVHSLQSGRRPSRLLDYLRRAHLLILGCNFDDWLARFFLRSYQERLLMATGTDYLADSTLARNDNLREFLEHFADRIRVYRDGDAEQFVDELHRRWMEAYPDGSAEPAPETVEARSGFLFLSYASEDRAVVARVHQAFDNAGIDSWFDRRELEVGDGWRDKIERHVRKCSFFLPIISRNTLKEERRYVRREWRMGVEESLGAKAKFLCPIVIDDTRPDEEGIPREFREVQWIPLTEGEPSEAFVEQFKTLHREYQRAEREGTR